MRTYSKLASLWNTGLSTGGSKRSLSNNTCHRTISRTNSLSSSMPTSCVALLKILMLSLTHVQLKTMNVPDGTVVCPLYTQKRSLIKHRRLRRLLSSSVGTRCSWMMSSISTWTKFGIEGITCITKWSLNTVLPLSREHISAFLSTANSGTSTESTRIYFIKKQRRCQLLTRTTRCTQFCRKLLE